MVLVVLICIAVAISVFFWLFIRGADIRKINSYAGKSDDDEQMKALSKRDKKA